MILVSVAPIILYYISWFLISRLIISKFPIVEERKRYKRLFKDCFSETFAPILIFVPIMLFIFKHFGNGTLEKVASIMKVLVLLSAILLSIVTFPKFKKNLRDLKKLSSEELLNSIDNK